MAKKTLSPSGKTPPLGTPEERYLDLWEERIRLIAANGPAQNPQHSDD